MPFSVPDATQYGSFVQTTQVWDVAQLQDIDIKSPQFKELLVRLYQQVGNIAVVLNTKDSGLYELSEFVNGQVWFSNPTLNSSTLQSAQDRQVLRTVINFGSLPNTGTKSVAHNISCTPMTTFTRIYATASDTTGFNYIPIPYASATAVDNIELNVNATNVNIITGSNKSNFNICYVILEYIQS
jgi:hypothetical protein